MNFQSQLRNRQDRLRNAGWRIQWIPWWELGKPEVIHSNNPLPLLGIVVFIGVFFWNNFNFFGITLTMPQVILISILGFGLAVLGILVSTMQAQSNWKKITAQCIDREICKGAKEPGAISSFWAYRLVCMFRFDGNPYKVTPNPPIQWPLPPSSKCINIWTKESALMDPAYYGLILITHFKLFFTKKDGGCKLSWLGCILVSMIANL